MLLISGCNTTSSMVQGEISLYRSLANKENISNFTDTQATNEVQPNCPPSEILRVLCRHDHSQFFKFGACIASSMIGTGIQASTQYSIVHTQAPCAMHAHLHGAVLCKGCVQSLPKYSTALQFLIP